MCFVRTPDVLLRKIEYLDALGDRNFATGEHEIAGKPFGLWTTTATASKHGIDLERF
jgi:hypothetical protein